MSMLTNVGSKRYCISGIDIRLPFSGVVFISVDDAQKALALNFGNRRLRPQLVTYLAKCITNNEWQPDHPQPIVFSSSGRMIDGQHRCQAIVEAEKGVDCNVVFGARDELREYIDTGISRTLEDRISFDPDYATNKHISQLINALAWLPNGRMKGRLTPEEAVSIFDRHRDGLIFGSRFVCQNKRGITRTAVGVALVEMFYRCPEKAEAFSNSIVLPDGPVQQARMLRDFLLTNSNGGDQASALFAYRKAVAAMKAHIEGREVKKLVAQNWD